MTHTQPRRDEGMSLVEVLIAIVILGIVSTAVLGVLVRTQASNTDSRARTAAAGLAQREIEYVREEFGRTVTSPLDIANAGVVTNRHPLAGGVAGQPLVLDGVPYTVSRSASWNVTGPGRSACEGGSLVQHPTLGVTVTVTWPDMGAVEPVVSHIQLAPPRTLTVSTSQAFVAVKVVDSHGALHPGRTVRVTSSGGASSSAFTDSAGCAVVAVAPPAGGAAYTAQLTDTGYVDIAGVANPSKTTGPLRPGQLSTSVSFTYDRAASLRLRVVGPDGAPLDDAVAAGAVLTLAATESSGASATSQHTATGTVTTLTGLWPSRYGAFFGVTPPPGGYTSVDLTPGGTGEIDVVLEMARASVGGLPPGTASVTVVPGTGACTDPGARTVDPAGFGLVPGTWTFYASGDAFDCAPGPSGVALGAGENGIQMFDVTGLTVSNAPAGGVLWAVSTTRATGLTTCAAAPQAGFAINVDAARSGVVEMPAGDWFVYRTDGPADGTCLSRPTAYPQAVPYGGAGELAWVDWRQRFSSVTLTVTNASSLGSSYRIIVTRSPVASCTNSTPSGATALGTLSSSTASGAVAPGTVYVYQHRTSGGSGNRCTPATGNPYTLSDLDPSSTVSFTARGVTTP